MTSLVWVRISTELQLKTIGLILQIQNKASQKVEKSIQKEPKDDKKDDFDFDFDEQNKHIKETSSDAFFDFGDSVKQNAQPKKENVVNNFWEPDLIGPSKPKFEDYFPEENNSDPEDSANLGLVSNLKKLYQKDGVIPEEDKIQEENILKPEIINCTEEFLPEVKIQGDNFWEERK